MLNILKLQFTAQYLSCNCSEDKDWYVFYVDMGDSPGNENEWYGYMNIEKPKKRIFFCLCPGIAEWEVK
jgi:hypothetical protein